MAPQNKCLHQDW